MLKRRFLALSLLSITCVSLATVAADNGDEKTSLEIARELYNKKKYSEALLNLDAIALKDTLVYEQTMLRCYCFLRLNNGEELTETFFESLDTSLDSLDVQKFYYDMRDILSSANRDRFDMLPAAGLRKSLTSYWRARDINPFTAENEYLLEHLRRLDFVRTFYSAPIGPGYDDRGRIYLKHGPPHDVVNRPSSFDTVPFESWQYLTNEGYHIFHFFDMFTTGIYSLETDIRYLQQSQSRKFSLDRFLEDCSELDPRYLTILQADSEVQEMYLAEEMHLRELDANVAEASDASFTPVSNKAIEMPVDFLFDFYRYKSIKYPSMVDINIVVALPASEINFRKSTEEQYESEVEVGAVYFDKNWEQFAKYDQMKKYNFDEKPKDSHYLFQGFWTRVPPGEYHLAIKAITADSRKGQIYRMGFDVESFRRDSLSISDIQIGSRIPKGAGYNEDEDRIPLVANPFHVFDKEKPLRIFFEIYNLSADVHGSSRYAVMYAVRSLDAKKETTISLRQEYEGEPNLERVILDVDISRLPRGKTQLTVFIEDLNNAESVERDYHFEIMR